MWEMHQRLQCLQTLRMKAGSGDHTFPCWTVEPLTRSVQISTFLSHHRLQPPPQLHRNVTTKNPEVLMRGEPLVELLCLGLDNPGKHIAPGPAFLQ